MKELKNYYRKWKRITFWMSLVIFIVLAIIFQALNEYVATHIAGMDFLGRMVIGVLLSAATPIGITLGGGKLWLMYVNNKRWKKKYPEYDVSGKWDNVSTYTHEAVIVGNTGKGCPSPASVETNIKQTCHSIEIEVFSNNELSWHSILADWNDKKYLEILYKVDYKEIKRKQGSPNERFGYEKMRIHTPPDGEKPKMMSGDFWHCVENDGKPMYMGAVTYTRK